MKIGGFVAVTRTEASSPVPTQDDEYQRRITRDLIPG